MCKSYTKHVLLSKCNGACCYNKLLLKKVCMYVCMCLSMYVHSAATFSHSRTQSVSPLITTSILSAVKSVPFPQYTALSLFEGRRRITDNDRSVLNKQQPTADRRWSSDMGVERGPKYYTGWIFQNDLRNGKTDMCLEPGMPGVAVGQVH